MPTTACPCGLGDYAQCCAPLHQGLHSAATAQQLMRSRYSAFALGEVDYIVDTTAIGQQVALNREAIRDWSQANQWLGLEIVSVNEQVDRQHAQVEFIAQFRARTSQQGESATLQQHRELSTFVKHNARWYFLDPTLEQTWAMKQACLCGSGKKFKHCCASYITE